MRENILGVPALQIEAGPRRQELETGLGQPQAALARQAQLLKPPGSLGRLEELAVWVAAGAVSGRIAAGAVSRKSSAAVRPRRER